MTVVKEFTESPTFVVWMTQKFRGMAQHRAFYVQAETPYEAGQAARKMAKAEGFTGAKVTSIGKEY